jgi:hypothetical protein
VGKLMSSPAAGLKLRSSPVAPMSPDSPALLALLENSGASGNESVASVTCSFGGAVWAIAKVAAAKRARAVRTAIGLKGFLKLKRARAILKKTPLQTADSAYGAEQRLLKG